jgi:hypothetical protein
MKEQTKDRLGVRLGPVILVLRNFFVKVVCIDIFQSNFVKATFLLFFDKRKIYVRCDPLSKLFHKVM